MPCAYNRRQFWSIAAILVLFLAAITWVNTHFAYEGTWRGAVWIGFQSSAMLPIFFFSQVQAILGPSWALRKQARRAAQGELVVIPPGEGAKRRHWASPVPWLAWAVVGFWIILMLSVWTDLLPRIFFGYRGALGQGLATAWSQESSPDGRWLALGASRTYGPKDNCLAIVDRRTGRTLTQPLPESVFDLAWSPDGRRMAAGRPGALDVLDPLNGTLTPFPHPPTGAFTFHPDGSLWILGGNGLWRWDPVAGTASRLGDGNKFSACMSLALAPDGGRLALAQGHQVRILETSQFREVALWARPGDLAPELRFCGPDTILMVSRLGGEMKSSLVFLEAGTGRETGRIPGLLWGPAPLANVDLSRDGRWLAAMRSDSTLAVWSMEARKWVWSAPVARFSYERCPRFSPDAREITTVGMADHSMMFLSTGHPVRRWHWR